jgi:hypothetical protein
MLLFYAHLQQKMLHRRFHALGIAPIVAYFLLVFAFIVLSLFLFLKTEEYAKYIYVFVAIASIYNWSETNRNDFLLSIFTKNDYRKIRFIENTALSLPFIAFLCYKNAVLMAAFLLIATNLLALIRLRKGSFFTMPTPFYRYPFEFTVGFRQTWLFVLGLYALAVVGVVVANINLSLVCLGGCGLLGAVFYSRLEPDFYIWIFAMKPEDFLLKKFNTANIYTILLGLPISLLLFCYDTSLIYMILATIGLSCWLIAAILFAKYAAYPHEISVPTTFLLLFGFLFPPFSLFLVPFFYNRAKKRLGEIL